MVYTSIYILCIYSIYIYIFTCFQYDEHNMDFDMYILHVQLDSGLPKKIIQNIDIACILCS